MVGSRSVVGYLPMQNMRSLVLSIRAIFRSLERLSFSPFPPTRTTSFFFLFARIFFSAWEISVSEESGYSSGREADLSSSVSVVSPNKDWAKAALASSVAFFLSAAVAPGAAMTVAEVPGLG